jgi:hypothetical protein
MEYIASTFGLKQKTSMKNVANRAALHAGILLGLFLDPEDGGDTFI